MRNQNSDVKVFGMYCFKVLEKIEGLLILMFVVVKICQFIDWYRFNNVNLNISSGLFQKLINFDICRMNLLYLG